MRHENCQYIFVRFFFLLILFFLSNSSTGQCNDVFDRVTECATENDSLVIYNNALKVYEFYEKNPDYVKLSSKRLKTKQDVIDCFFQLQDAVDSFYNRWLLRERVINGGEDLPYVLIPRDGKNIEKKEYYSYLDEYRFYQRELENGILNLSAPFPLYDVRIAPLVINSYENRYSNDEFNGDFVNVALYIPVTIKPYSMLTEEEKVMRNKILQGTYLVIKKTTNLKPVIPVSKKKNTKDTTLLQSANITYEPPKIEKLKTYTHAPWGATPIYYYNSYGSGHLMGFAVGRKFRKYLETDEYYELLPKWLKQFLKDDKELLKYLTMRYGAWFTGFYEDKTK